MRMGFMHKEGYQTAKEKWTKKELEKAIIIVKPKTNMEMGESYVLTKMLAGTEATWGSSDWEKLSKGERKIYENYKEDRSSDRDYVSSKENKGEKDLPMELKEKKNTKGGGLGNSKYAGGSVIGNTELGMLAIMETEKKGDQICRMEEEDDKEETRISSVVKTEEGMEDLNNREKVGRMEKLMIEDRDRNNRVKNGVEGLQDMVEGLTRIIMDIDNNGCWKCRVKPAVPEALKVQACPERRPVIPIGSKKESRNEKKLRKVKKEGEEVKLEEKEKHLKMGFMERGMKKKLPLFCTEEGIRRAIKGLEEFQFILDIPKIKVFVERLEMTFNTMVMDIKKSNKGIHIGGRPSWAGKLQGWKKSGVQGASLILTLEENKEVKEISGQKVGFLYMQGGTQKQEMSITCALQVVLLKPAVGIPYIHLMIYGEELRGYQAMMPPYLDEEKPNGGL
ncbi:hypothetical protein C7212DRAFT_363588 [Tuber magnatum]|uniref:Uncharacterized protein n=1 Tax=Tuber magnatum TaxID=42249 RepID=A0A317SQK9_9PEZI|nr:hypothetical protein C7212DRAFT_363588 [Tuber magnatum]